MVDPKLNQNEFRRGRHVCTSGLIFSKDKSAYNYLLNSAELFPSGTKFSNILKSVGFADVLIKPKLFGSSTIYVCKR